MTIRGSHPLDKTIHHALFAGLVEPDSQLVAVHGGDVAVAEFQVKHAPAYSAAWAIPVGSGISATM